MSQIQTVTPSITIFLLNIEDDIFEAIVVDERYTIERYETIPNDLQILVSLQPSIIIASDFDTCQQLVEQEIACPIMIALAQINHDRVSKVFEIGASDYITLPLQINEFEMRVQSAINRLAHTQANRHHLAILVENSPNALAIFDTEMRYLHANATWKKDYHLGDIDLIGRSHYEIFPEIGDDWKSIHQRCLTGEIDRSERAPFPRSDGTLDWIKWDVRPWYTDDGTVGGILMYTEVITDSINTLIAHQEAEVRYTQMINNATDGILILRDNQIVFRNRTACHLLGIDADSNQAIDFLQFIAPNQQKIIQSALATHAKDAQPIRLEIHVITLKNVTLDVELTIDTTTYQDQESITVILRDISERKLAEMVVAETQHRLQAQAESLITINHIAESLHNSLDLEDLATNAIEACTRYLSSDIAAFYFANNTEKVFELVVASGSTPDITRAGEQLPYEGSLTGRLIEEKSIIIVNDIATDDRLYNQSQQHLSAESISQVICIPALHDNQVLGAVNIGFINPRNIDDETFTTLLAIGQTLGLALHNTRTIELLVKEIYERQSAEEALQLSEERLKSVITTVPIILFAIDNDGIFTIFEGRGLSSLGLDSETIVGQNVVDAIADNEAIRMLFAHSVPHAEGFHQVNIEDTTFEIYYSTNENGVTGVGIDVTDRVRGDQLQRMLFNISRATSEASDLATLLSIVHQEITNLIDADNFFVALYDEDTQLYSFPYWQDEEETESDSWDDQPLTSTLTDYVRQTGQPLIIDHEMHTKMRDEGLVKFVGPMSPIWLGVPLRTNKEIIGVMVIQSYRDRYAYDLQDLDVMTFIGENIAWVIESKQSEDALRMSEERFSKAFYSSPDSITITRMRDGYVIDANEGLEQVFGYKREEAVGQFILDMEIYHNEDDRQRLLGILQSDGVVRHFEMTGRHKSGELRDCIVSAELITIRDEQCIVSIARDVTKQKVAEQSLRKSEETAREFQEKLRQLHEISFELSRTDSLSEIYRRAIELGRSKLGYDRMGLFLIDLPSDTIFGTFGTDEAGHVRDESEIQRKLSDDQELKHIADGGWQTVINLEADLTDYWQVIGQGWHGVASLWDGAQVNGIVVVDNLLNKQPARPYEEELLTMFGAVLGYVISGKQSDNTRTQMVEQLQLLNSIDRAILAARSPRAIANAVHRQLAELVGADYVSIISLDDKKQEYELLAQTDMDTIPRVLPYTFANEIILNPDLRRGLRYDEMNLDLVDELSSAEERLYEKGIRSFSLLPLMANAELVGLLTIGLKIPHGFTEDKYVTAYRVATQLALAFQQSTLLEQVRKYANELEVLVEERTGQLSAKAKELEAFTYSVSHDLRSPLRAISGFADVIMEDFEDTLDPEATYYLRRIHHNANRLGDLIDDLLRLSRVGRRELETRTIQPAMIVSAIIEELRADEQLGHAVFEIDDLPACEGDPILIKQLWVNLLTNAIKYSKLQEKPLIKIGATIEDGAIIYFIQDNGIGFEMEYADKLFGVFQRLHNSEAYEGTGIGLATVHRIVERHGGRIWADAQVDQGATFYFTLSE